MAESEKQEKQEKPQEKPQQSRDKQPSGKKVRKKKWVGIVTDDLFGKAHLGESLVFTADDLNKRIIEANLMTLTNDMKQQNVNVRFKINTIEGDVAVGSMISYEITPSSIRRLVRKEVERIDTSFVAETKDGVKLRIKPLLITKTGTSASKATMIRKTAMDFIVTQTNQFSYDEFCRQVLGKSMQGQLKANLKKIFPIRVCEIRNFEITTRGVPTKVVPAKAKPEEPKEDLLTDESPEEVISA